MKKTLILAAAFACASFTANAAGFTDTWSTWDADYQSIADYNAGNGFVKSDLGSTGGTVLSLVNGNPYAVVPDPRPTDGSYQGHAFLGNALYNSRSLPTFTFTNTNELMGITQVTLSMIYGRGDTNSVLATLASGGESWAKTGVQVDYNPAPGPQSTDAYKITYTWDFDAPVDLDGFTVTFTVGAQRIGYENFTLSVVAVPEPSTYALIAGAFGLAAVVVARRRRA